MSMLTIKDISKSFKKRKVVDGASFSVESGQVVGLLGPNGAGKTTSFYMVVGLVQPDSGTINLDETNITQEPMYKRARVGLSYLAQEPSIFRKLTVAENIIVALEAHGYSGASRSEKLEQLIGDFHVGHIRDSYGYALSGGERRRVEIARALAGSPKFILLDEPFAGIDPIAVADIQNIIRELKAKGIGVLITDHNVRETLGICDYAYILKDGKIQVSGSSDEIANSELARKFYLGENFKL
ncbi:LPS export ABC transporter ATP-binding protein [Bdellovibrio bacteriovorus]|uniref:ABC-type nitrate transporter, ATPase component n=2 Tax=Bdellovibrio bacteriovorus TaxID=959 RepID=Q6MPL0_BDEBA|nr:LPS export ABC transporter ATP-binding protein [Bdellovibrio bacteriovorus]AHZ86896.1 sugar ABC transporter ATP-binding protein [Bdellovibrio bacteriovorus]ASD64654.1 ABC transporter ATP-binding protein [Bdellovibrio bacteriovorus]BEV67337.1 Lipopolysaccharide export system ATP-binding protein LptB [Bdellovibrio bacteriovorus]CAE78787.1 ABC-type nitrate transporter, ATPase component [Bdellovibrio bacteriovorus HD100]